MELEFKRSALKQLKHYKKKDAKTYRKLFKPPHPVKMC